MKSRVFGVALAGLLAIGLAGCSTPVPAASPGPTPPFASADAAYKAAEATYRGYVDALNQVNLEDPKTFEPVYGWLMGDALEEDKREFTSMASADIRLDGDSSVVAMKARPSKNARWGDVSLDTCLDVHRVSITSASGKSLVEDDRPNVQSVKVVFARDAGTGTGLKIINMKAEKGALKCAQ